MGRVIFCIGISENPFIIVWDHVVFCMDVDMKNDQVHASNTLIFFLIFKLINLLHFFPLNLASYLNDQSSPKTQNFVSDHPSNYNLIN